MRISSDIDYHGPQVYTFDPQKVLARIETWFSNVVINDQDLAQAEIERFVQFLTDQHIIEPRRSRLLRQIHDKAKVNGPAYTFTIEPPNHKPIQGQVARYEVFFDSSQSFDLPLENQIITFLQSLEIGNIRCDTPTKQFLVPDPVYRGYWLLAMSEE